MESNRWIYVTEPFPQFSDMPTMKIDLADIQQFGQRARTQPVKNNIVRATEIGFDLLRQCSSLVGVICWVFFLNIEWYGSLVVQDKQTTSQAAKLEIFEQLKEEYAQANTDNDALIGHLESLVKQLTTENAKLTKTLTVCCYFVKVEILWC